MSDSSNRRDAARAPDGPDVSIIIASYNQGAFLGEAIESALAQAGCTIEVIVVDDGSTDDSCAVAARYPGVILLRQPRLGACVGRNRGMISSSGRFLVFLDGDDRMHPHAVNSGLAAMREQPDCAMVFGGFQRISPTGEVIGLSPPPAEIADHFAHFLLRNSIVLHAAMFRREPLLELGGFIPEDWAAADYDLYLRATRNFPAACHGQIVADRRIHAHQASGANAHMLGSALRILRRQWKYAKHRPDWRNAYFTGRRHYQEWFGERAILDTRCSARQGNWRQAAAQFVALLRYYPAGALSLLR